MLSRFIFIRTVVLGCGLACHIGARTGIATIGVAKNFVVSPLTALGAEKSIVKKAEEV